jgi:hypothetical protein
MQATQLRTPRPAADAAPAARDDGVLSAQELLAGSALVHEVAIPAEVLRPGSGASGAAGVVRIRPVRVGTLALIARAAREDASLVPLLMIRDAVVEPALELEQIKQMHAGLLHYLVERINLLSGLATADDAHAAAAAPIGEAHVLLARHFGWTPQQVAELTPGQVAVYLAGVERLLALDAVRTG